MALELVHIALSALGSLAAILIGFVVHDLRGRITRLERDTKENGEHIAELRGRILKK